MRKQDFLIELVKSLSPSESRYFRLYGSIQPGEKKYIDLFDELEKGINSTGELCHKLKITPTNLGVLKQYLYQMLMRCLRNYQEQASHVSVINNSKEDARILLNKYMLKHALSVTEKALAKAWDLEVFEAISDLLDIKTQCLYNFYQPERIAAISLEYTKLVAIQSELIEMNALVAKSLQFDTKRDNPKNFEKLYCQPLLKKSVSQLKSVRAQVRWFDIWFCAMMDGDNNSKALAIARQEYQHYQKHKKVKQINPIAYVVNLTRIANAEAECDNYSQALAFSDKTTAALKDPSLEITKARRDGIMGFNKFFRIYVLLRMEDFKAVVNESMDIEEMMKTRPDTERYSSVFYYAIALLHTHQDKAAIDKANELLQIKTSARIDLQTFARLIHIMAQYSCANYQLIPYLVKSAKAWMKRNKQIYPEFDLFFTQILLASKSSLPERKKGLIQLLTHVSHGKLNDIERTLFLKRWIADKGITQITS